jgi:hypothetical protein
MGFLDNVANKAVPEGSGLAKPLILAFTALLASGVLRRKQEPALLLASAAASSAQGLFPSVWQGQRGSLLKVLAVDPATAFIRSKVRLLGWRRGGDLLL